MSLYYAVIHAKAWLLFGLSSVFMLVHIICYCVKNRNSSPQRKNNGWYKKAEKQ